MSSWRDRILREFTPKVAKLTLVADPDGLLLEEGILEGIHARGFELIPFEDPIAFRYAYESKYRSRWDKGEDTDLVVVLRSGDVDLIALPYDLVQVGRKLSFNLGAIFENFSYPVIAALDRGDLDALYEAQQNHAPGELGDNATKEFVLRHVFGTAPELIKQPSDLLRVLLRRHYRRQRIPQILDDRFIQLLRQNEIFNDWSLETLIPDREVFFSFLQERWPFFLDRMASNEEAGILEAGKPFDLLALQGPVDIPFDHHDIRIYIDNLFIEGMLHSVSHKNSDSLAQTWAGVGVQNDPSVDRERRLSKLLESIQSAVPAENARHGDWLHFSRGWSELILLAGETQPEVSLQAKIKTLQALIDTSFSAWLKKRYAGLVNLPPVPPVMLHHLPRFFSRQIEDDPGTKIALIVVDGLAMDQWLVIRETLASQKSGFRYREQSVFAWIPTLTSVSRQAIFAGKAPIFFPNCIHTTDKEPALWKQFWMDQGFMQNEVLYAKGLGHGGLDDLSQLLSHPQAKIAGLVIDKVDKIMHGMQMGTAGMHNQVRQWAQQPYLHSLFDLLLDHGFRIYLTSDHGNIEAEGCGRPAEGAVADLRGERVRIYNDGALRNKVKAHFSEAVEWASIGIPEDYLPLLAPARRAFINKGKNTVSHGGAAIEEIIVPFVQIERI